MVDFWALPRLIWLWLFFILFFLEKKKKSISLIKSPGADSGFAFFGNIIIYFTTYQFLGQIFIDGMIL
jgi:hypothetical protein